MTGRVYSTQESPFLRVDLLWNHRNLWVNMQGTELPAARVDFDLTDARKWETVLPPSSVATAHSDEVDDDAAVNFPATATDMGKDDVVADETRTLIEMPPSWVTRLHVPRDLFQVSKLIIP